MPTGAGEYSTASNSCQAQQSFTVSVSRDADEQPVFVRVRPPVEQGKPYPGRRSLADKLVILHRRPSEDRLLSVSLITFSCWSTMCSPRDSRIENAALELSKSTKSSAVSGIIYVLGRFRCQRRQPTNQLNGYFRHSRPRYIVPFLRQSSLL
jgi:hypothetical protein